MREWRRALGPTRCGGCEDAVLRKGDPIYVVRVEGEAYGGPTRELRRCRPCAQRLYGEAPPADLPELQEPIPVPTTVHMPTGPEALPFDYKTAQCREPGEDDA